MMARSFFAELQRQAKVAARETARAAREAERERKAIIREVEQAQKANERAAAQLARAKATEQKQLAKKAREAHIAAMEAEVNKKNLELVQMYDEIDSLLAATLVIDDYVDLNTLRIVVEHPPFDRSDLETPIPTPTPIADPPEPIFTPPPPPKGLKALLFKKKHEKAVTNARATHERAHESWQSELTKVELARKEAVAQHSEIEAQRIKALEKEKERYAMECSDRDKEAVERNKAIDTLIANLGYGDVEAVQEYVSIVLSNSVYPEHFSVEHRFEFDATTAELFLRVLVPSPDKVPTTNTYKYKKASDEITSTSLSQKACKERYANAMHQVALRSIHEIFEADRRGIIKTISLVVGTETIVPATGREEYIPFVAVGAERDSFLELNLENVVPSATLGHLGAAVSKNPFELIAVDISGIRGS